MKEKVSSIKIYTKKGDNGYTKNMSGDTLWKGDMDIEAMGQFDELMAQVDKILAILEHEYMSGFTEEDSLEEHDFLKNIRDTLWMTSADISTSKNKVKLQSGSLIDENKIEQLEKYIDACELYIDKFISFRNLLAVEVNEARVRTRRLERTLCMINPSDEIKSYINRLSDFFFAMAVTIERNDV